MDCNGCELGQGIHKVVVKIAEKTVLIMDCNGCELGQGIHKVVVKIGINVVKWENITKSILDESESMDKATEKARNIVENEFMYHFGQYTFSDRDAIAIVLGKELKQYVNETSSTGSNFNGTIRTLLALALQNEYTKLVGVKGNAFAPQLYGFCGPAFFMEYAPPLTLLGYTLPLKAIGPELIRYRFNMKPWPERACVALDMIQSAKASEQDADGVAQICDIHQKNAGLNTRNHVVFFDLDYTRYRMVFADRKCKEDRTCRFASCQGYCDTKTRKCMGTRANNNLQAFCEKVLYGTMGINGILRFPPTAVRSELNTVLGHCVNPKTYYKNPRTNKAGTDIAERLEHVLRKSIHVWKYNEVTITSTLSDNVHHIG